MTQNEHFGPSLAVLHRMNQYNTIEFLLCWTADRLLKTFPKSLLALCASIALPVIGSSTLAVHVSRSKNEGIQSEVCLGGGSVRRYVLSSDRSSHKKVNAETRS